MKKKQKNRLDVQKLRAAVAANACRPKVEENRRKYNRKRRKAEERRDWE